LITNEFDIDDDFDGTTAFTVGLDQAAPGSILSVALSRLQDELLSPRAKFEGSKVSPGTDEIRCRSFSDCYVTRFERLFRILCQRKNTRSIRSQIECSIKPAFKEDGQLR